MYFRIYLSSFCGSPCVVKVQIYVKIVFGQFTPSIYRTKDTDVIDHISEHIFVSKIVSFSE